MPKEEFEVIERRIYTKRGVHIHKVKEKKFLFRAKGTRRTVKSDIESYSELEQSVTKPKKPKFKKYTYLISADYKKKGRKGKHPFHSEFKVVSPKPLSMDEIADMIINRYDEFSVLSDCEFREIKGEEIEEIDQEPSTELQQLSYHHKG